MILKQKQLKQWVKQLSILARIKAVAPHYTGIHCIFHSPTHKERAKSSLLTNVLDKPETIITLLI